MKNFIKEYVRFESVSADSTKADQMEKTRAFLKENFEKMGFNASYGDDRCSVFFANKIVDKNATHIVIYGHYDVQPADPLELWNTPAFEPVEKDGRLYARGAADNKGPTSALIFAVKEAFEQNPDLKLNFTFIIEGEEETGGDCLPKFLEENKEYFKSADFLLVSDTLSPSEDQISITTALRGITGLELKILGPSHDLHSGIFGGACPNPIQVLTKICASFHNDDASVAVEGFYDDVKEPALWEKLELEKYPCSDEDFLKTTGAKGIYSAKNYNSLEATRFLPTLDFNGISGGYEGEGSKTIIPSSAFVKITSRLVANQNEEDIYKKIVKHIHKNMPSFVDYEIARKEGGSPYMINVPTKDKSVKAKESLTKAFELIDKNIESIFANKPLYVREGGSIPVIEKLNSITNLDCIMVGLFTPKDNLHSPNEGTSIKMLEKAKNAFKNVFLNFAQDK